MSLPSPSSDITPVGVLGPPPPATHAITKETCWTLSNIVAGTPEQMALVCDAPRIIPGVIEELASGAWEVQKEANFVVSNIATSSNGGSIAAVLI